MASRLTQWLPGLGLMVISALACIWLELRPVPGSRTVALLYPPWWTTTHIFLAAMKAGSVVRFGLSKNIVVLAPASGGMAPLSTGAWAVLDSRYLGGCSVIPVKDTRS